VPEHAPQPVPVAELLASAQAFRRSNSHRFLSADALTRWLVDAGLATEAEPGYVRPTEAARSVVQEMRGY
jgi:hypothetical protein